MTRRVLKMPCFVSPAGTAAYSRGCQPTENAGMKHKAPEGNAVNDCEQRFFVGWDHCPVREVSRSLGTMVPIYEFQSKTP